MDAGFKSPRPPAPRRSRSRAASVSNRVASFGSNNNGSSSNARQQQQQHEDYSDDEHDVDGVDYSASSPAPRLTASNLLTKLEGLLVAKSNEIVLAGRLGESLLTQQAELEARIRELEEDVQASDGRGRAGAGGAYVDSDEESVVLGPEAREKLEALESELKHWERGNQEIYRAVAPPGGTPGAMSRQASSASMRSRATTPPPPLPTSTTYTGEFNPPVQDVNATPTSPSSSRRQRNAQHRATDMEFATEIGQSLLIEVRRLQALLTERDAQLAASKAEKDGMERSMEGMASGLKSVEESLDKYREENWNLEVQNQEIRTHLTDISSNLSKVEQERTRVVKELASTREILDSQKLDNERHVAQLDTLKNRHETDMANMRRTTASLQREKTDIQTALDGARNEIAARNRGIRRSASATSNMTATGEAGHGPGGLGNDFDDAEDGEEEDVFGIKRSALGNRRKTNDHLEGGLPSESETPDGSPIFSGHLTDLNDSEKLRGSLSAAQKTIQTLRAALIREKEAKMALKRKLKGGDAGDASEEDEEIHDEDDEEPDQYEEDDNSLREAIARRPTGTGHGRRGRGRGRGGVVVASRRGGLAGRVHKAPQPSRLSSEVPVDDEEEYTGSVGGDGSLVDHGDTSEQEELASYREDERDDLRASRSSLASIDPAFADILPASGAQPRPTSGLGSLRDNRPSSAMFAADFNLAEQLKKQEDEMAALRKPPVETREFSVQTDDIPPPPEPEPRIVHVEVQVPARKPPSAESSCQTEPLPPPLTPEPQVLYVDREVQVPAPKPPAAESASQTDAIPPPPEPEPRVVYVDREVQVQVPTPKPASRELSVQTDDVPPPPVPEPRVVHVEVPVAAPKPDSQDLSVQTDEVPAPPESEPKIVHIEVPSPKPPTEERSLQTEDLPPSPMPEPKIVHVEVPVAAPKPESREYSIQTDDLPPPPKPETIYVKVPFPVPTPAPEPVKPETRELASQTDPAVVPVLLDKSLQTDAEVPVVGKEATTMTEPVRSEEQGVQTEAAQARSYVEKGSDPHVQLFAADEDADSTANHSTLAFHSVDDDNEATTPRLESTPTFPERILPDVAAVPSQYTHRPNYSVGNRSMTENSSVAPSFKSFQNTDYDTATETDGDFEDARENLATFDGTSASPSLSHFSNASHSTILRSAVDSDGDSEYGGSALATPRYPRVLGRQRGSKEPVDTKEMGTSPIKELEAAEEIQAVKQHQELGTQTDDAEASTPMVPVVTPASEPVKPVLVDAGIQTDDMPIELPVVVSPTATHFSDVASQTSAAAPDIERRSSAATFGIAGDAIRRGSDDAFSATSQQKSAPAGLVYLERSGGQPLVTSSASVISRRSSINTTTSVGADSFVPPPMPVSPSKARAPKLSIPPPPGNPPPAELIKQSKTPTFKPPRPSSPPPPDLLQRAQTPTFLAPGSVSRKRQSSSEGATGAVLPPGAMPLHRNEHHFGASAAPLPHNRPPSTVQQQPRAVASAAQLRGAPALRYQAASTEPAATLPEHGNRQGASTPVNQMLPSNRFGSAKRHSRRAAQGTTTSRASVSSLGSGHSRGASIASSRTSDAGGNEGLPTPSSRRRIGSNPADGGSTDPHALQCITQCMIGEYMFKYTRNTIFGGTSEKRHQRYFWIHPYNKTLYWGTTDPASVGTTQTKSKSVFIAGVRTETDTNPNPPGLHQTSIVIHTGGGSAGREIKFTARTKERHDMWMTAIQYLINRPEYGSSPHASTEPANAVGGVPGTPSSSSKFSLGRSITRSASSMRFRQRSGPTGLDSTTMTGEMGELGVGGRPSSRNDTTLVPAGNKKEKKRESTALYVQQNVSEPRLTPKPSKSARRSTVTSLYKRSETPGPEYQPKRSDTPAAEYQSYIAEFGSPRSVRSYARPGTSLSTYGQGASSAPAHARADEADVRGLGDESVEIVDRRDALGAQGEDVHGPGYEGLENVRACCNGEHDVGKLSVSRKHHKHHHHRHQHQHHDNPSTSILGSGNAGTGHTLSSRNNSVASRMSRRSMFGAPAAGSAVAPSRSTEPARSSKADAQLQQSAAAPPVPAMGRFDEPGSPSLRASTLRGRNNSSTSKNSSSDKADARDLFRSTSPTPESGSATVIGRYTATRRR